MKSHAVLEVRGITKYFGDLPANSRIDFDLGGGEIHVLLGENGAGKSTLMNIICGLYTPDEGEIYVDGRKTAFRNPHDAIRLGIGMVHQHFMLVPRFTVTENVMLGAEVTRGPYLNTGRARKLVRDLSSDFGLRVNPDAVIEDLPVGIQQRVEIIKTLYRQVRILVLDEPTAVLTPLEVEELFKVMRLLSKRGVSIIFITHKLKEVLDVAHRISVMRRGRLVETAATSETDEQTLARVMVGRDVEMETEKAYIETGAAVLDVSQLNVLDDRQMPVVADVSFKVSQGEVFGLAGVQGNGQTELAAALCGLRKIESGTVSLNGKVIHSLSPRILVDAGVAHIPEDRLKHGLVRQYTIADNQVLNTYYQPPFANYLHRSTKAVFENSARLIRRFNIQAAGPETVVGTLSGGNLQKVIVSRELSRDLCLLIANQPTRGLDVASIAYVRRQIVKLRNQGVAVLLISVELDEIMSLSDRIAVMFNGRIGACYQADQVTREELGIWMTGHSRVARVAAGSS
jgi:simple sugar transport system ATP-binding protein